MKIHTKELASNVNFLEIDNKKYILKKILNSFSNNCCKKKNKYMRFLRDGGIIVPRTEVVFFNNEIYEIQEYIEGEHPSFITEKMFEYLANFHNISRKYKTIFNKRLYSIKIYIKNIELNKLLVGFKEKYYVYPLKAIKELNIDKKIKERITLSLKLLYNSFVNNFGIEDCIIHNDLTSNNFILMNDNKIAFIDFDLAIRSSVYVDIGDLIFTRQYKITDYKQVFTKRRDQVESYVKAYNKFAEKKVSFKGIINFASLKLLSYFLYIHTKVKILKLEELEEVLDFIKLVESEIL